MLLTVLLPFHVVNLFALRSVLAKEWEYVFSRV